MLERIKLKEDNFEELVDKARIGVFIRLANTQHNWLSNADREIVRKLPELKEVDEQTSPNFGGESYVVKEVVNPFVIGRHHIDCYNCYCLEKDSSGRFILDEKVFKDFLNKLEENKREKIFALVVKNEGAISKALVYKVLQRTIQFNKVWILG